MEKSYKMQQIVFTQSNICFSAMELLSMIWKMILQKNKSVKWQLKPRETLRTTLRKFLCSEKFKSYAIELQSTDVITPTTESFRQQLNPLQVKFGYYEKATKFEKIFKLKFDVTEWRQILSGRFFQILWPSQNI